MNFSAERLGGLTNRTYKFGFEGERYIARFAGNRTGDIIDRYAEARNAQIASERGLGPEIVYCDPRSGLMVTRFIDGAASPKPGTLKHGSMLRRVVGKIKSLHALGPVLASHFKPFRTIERYGRYLKKRGGRTPRGYQAGLRKAQVIRSVLRVSRYRPTACHVDPLPDNFLDTGSHIYLIDWEYAGNGDRFWDLATLSIEAAFEEENDRALLEIYLGRQPRASELARLGLYKIVSDLMWTPWAAIQKINGNQTLDYRAYGAARCERAIKAMAGPDFGQQLRAAADVAR